ncbi:unnamed protein product [Peniophora sp. CBMAI 1063]|nr:unnamed protein product [Peniophora sp. CBMAI 1063]
MAIPTVAPLPSFPSAGARESLSPSQLATLYAKVSNALEATLALPPEKRDTSQTVAFITSYARDGAQETLQTLICESSSYNSRETKLVRSRVLQLAERVASSGLLPLSTLLDLSILYAPHPSRLKSLLEVAFSASPNLHIDLPNEAVPAFTQLLGSSAAGLYGLRKTAHCLLSFARVAPAEARLTFARSTPFMTALATAYDAGLAALARSYGGLSTSSQRAPDEWERLLVETKVALLDTFHILLKSLFESLSLAHGALRTSAAARALDMLLTLQELPPAPSGSAPMPFLNRPLLVDYQATHDLAKMLEKSIARAERAEDNARIDVLAASLRAMNDGSKEPGALVLLLGSGAQPGIHHRGHKPSPASSAAPVASSSKNASELDAQVKEVLSILPDTDEAYVRSLLSHPDFAGVERTVGALLEGTAPPPEQLTLAASSAPVATQDEFEFTRDRANVFDAQEMDLSRVHVGKKKDDASALLADRSFVSSMKADILRRAEAASSDEEEDDDDDGQAALAEVFGLPAPSKKKARNVAFDEEDEMGGAVKVIGDGEESDESDAEREEGGEGKGKGKEDPYAQLELAWLANPGVFERDAVTRRGKDRAALRAQTGLDDGQIEGWFVMLERNPKQKDRINQKHEFRGNQPSLPPSSAEPSRSNTPTRGGRGRGGGGVRGGRGRGGGGGGGRGGGPGGGGGGDARDRARKDKRGNQARKRGHDKKMARAGGPS